MKKTRIFAHKCIWLYSLLLTLTILVNPMTIKTISAKPLVKRIVDKEPLIRHRLGFINFSPTHLSYALEIEKIIFIQSSLSYYQMLDEGHKSFNTRFSWPGLIFRSKSKDEALYRQMYGIGLGFIFSEQTEAPQRKQAYLQEFLIPIVIDFDLSYVYKKSGFNLFGGLGINVKAGDRKQRQERDQLEPLNRFSLFFELGVGYSF